jgi:uncharacterized protein YecE (DUF72 family)
MPFDRQEMQQAAAELAANGVFIGTSSWKYDGWFGRLYDPARYKKATKVSSQAEEGWFTELQVETRPKKPEKIDDDKFERECLTEYAEVFKTVSVDATYYKFPSQHPLESLVSQVPADFKFGFKVTGDVTIKKFSRDRRYGARAGNPNENFLNADLFLRAFLQPCESIRKNVGIIMFEFSHFYPNDFKHPGDFVTTLDSFFNNLPSDWPYGIELRNQDWLTPEYFACLARHGVAHVFNSWEMMPPVREQMALEGSRTNPNLVAARFLLKPGRKYQEAKDTFKPYAKVQDEYPDARKAGKALITEGKVAGKKRETFIYVNNRLEGNALETIAAMVGQED